MDASLQTNNSDPTGLSAERPEYERKIAWPSVVPLVAIHVTAIALAPLTFSWAGLWVGVIAGHLISPVGINLTYHRVLAHRSLTLPKWLEHTFVVIGLLSLEGPPVQWVATHRCHHRRVDTELDPHSPVRGFFWSHIGWLFVRQDPWLATSYARDLLRDPFYRWLQGGFRWFAIYLVHVALFFAGAVLAGWLAWHDMQAAMALGISVLVWGVLVRQVYVWHVTWGVNSITHILGYRNYETPDRSRNNWFWGLLSMGEGWHNNHHHDPASASNWHRVWEVDATYLIIRALELVGLATDVKRPRHIRRRVGEETMRWTQWP